MGNIRFTKDQQKVIDAHGCSLLVSAAAGSGKTAVLVERIIKMIMDEKNQTTIDRLLVVTFTNAAAAEMRERVGQALYSAIEMDPSNIYLQHQLMLLPSASIMTLHAFCLQVIKNYFNEIDLDPSFTIGDETELALLKQEILEETLEEFYEKADGGFIALVEAYASGKSDRAIEELVLDIYRLSMSHPEPMKWLNDSVSRLNIKTTDDWYNSLYVDYIISDIKKVCQGLSQLIDQGEALIGEDEKLAPMLVTLDAHKDKMVSLLERLEDRDQLFEYLATMTFDRAKSAKRGTDEQLVAPVKLIISEIKEQLKNLSECYGYIIDDVYLTNFKMSYHHIYTLVEVVSTFKNHFDIEKNARNVIDFNDIEHFALSILIKDGVPSDIAKVYQEQFDEIMVDEYQDSNLVGETLVQCVSTTSIGRPNVFMVGDMKQSIYKFRLAKPELFARKYDTYEVDGTEYRKIELHQNFRSRVEVLDFTNYLFKQIMSKEIGDVTYDDHAALYEGATYKVMNDDYKTKIVIPDKTTYKGMTTREIDAKQTAVEIEKLMHSDPPIMVFDKHTGCERAILYKDIAVLLRTMSGWSEIFVDTLLDHQIPVKSHTATGYFDAIEIQTVLNVLSVIDNPKQDIPLLSVLRSPMFLFTGDDLVTIRLASKKTDFHFALMAFYESILGSSELEIKVTRFVKMLNEWRDNRAHKSIYELISIVFEDTGYYDYVSLMIGGAQRQANLEMFKEQVYRYEQSSYKGLFNFIRYMSHIKKQSIDYGVAQVDSDTTNQVAIMSIHKSKGLEYPVVIVPGLSKQFNKMDLNKSVLQHQDLGFGTNFIDVGRKVKYKSPIKQVIRQQMDIELKSEEMRIFYVALTRAREKLILIGSVKDVDSYTNKWAQILSEENVAIAGHKVRTARCFLDWVFMSVMRHKASIKLYNDLGHDFRAPIGLLDIEPSMTIEVVSHETMVRQVAAEKMHQTQNGMTQAEIEAKFSWQYDHMEATTTHISQSVSSLKKLEDHQVVEKNNFEDAPGYRPLFITGERPLTGAEKGTIYHKVMDKLDFSADVDRLYVDKHLEQLVFDKVITQKEMKSVKKEAVVEFFNTEVGQRAKKASLDNRLYKEAPFVMGIEKDDEDMMMIQGVVDMFFEEADGLVLVDYKTDYMKNIDDEVMAGRYKNQMYYYKVALEQKTGKVVKSIYLYAVGSMRLIDIIV